MLIITLAKLREIKREEYERGRREATVTDEDLEECREQLEESSKEERRAIVFATEKARELAECREQLTAKVEKSENKPDELKAKPPEGKWYDGRNPQAGWYTKSAVENQEALHSDDRFHPTVETTDRVKAELAECREALKETGQEKRHAQEFAAKKARELAKMRVALQECREELAAMREVARSHNNALLACEEKKGRMRRQNELMRNDLDHYKAEYLKCRKALAAAEARAQKVVDLLRHIPQVPSYQLPDRGWIPGGSLTIGAVSEAIDMARRMLHEQEAKDE